MQRWREQLYGLADTALFHLEVTLAKSPRTAYTLLCDLGVVPSAIEVQALREAHPEPASAEEQRIKAQMLKLVDVAYERAKIFGGPVPTMADIEEEDRARANRANSNRPREEMD